MAAGSESSLTNFIMTLLYTFVGVIITGATGYYGGNAYSSYQQKAMAEGLINVATQISIALQFQRGLQGISHNIETSLTEIQVKDSCDNAPGCIEKQFMKANPKPESKISKGSIFIAPSSEIHIPLTGQKAKQVCEVIEKKKSDRFNCSSLGDTLTFRYRH